MGNLLNSILGEREANNGVSIIGAIVAAIVPMGQLWGRIFWLDGSLDKIWLMIPFFWMLPLSIIPALLMYFGYIKKGKGGKPYDVFMWIPIAAKFLLALLIPMFLGFFYDEEEDEEPSDTMIFLTTFIVQLVIGMVPNLIRAFDLCKEVSFNSFGKAFVDSTIANATGELLPFIMGWLPFVGIGMTILGFIPFVGEQVENIIWALGFFIGYVFVNMFNADNMEKYCKPDFFGRDIFDKIGFFVMLGITLFVKVFNEFSPI
jgi:hypothetical protein